MKERKGGWQLFNIDSLVSQASAETPLADFIDLAVASLAFKNFDFVAKRLPLLVECSTRDPSVWLQLVDRAAPLGYSRL